VSKREQVREVTALKRAQLADITSLIETNRELILSQSLILFHRSLEIRPLGSVGGNQSRDVLVPVNCDTVTTAGRRQPVQTR